MKTSFRLSVLPLVIVASLAAVGCVADAGDMAENSVSAPLGDEEGRIATVDQALTTAVIIKNVNSQKVLNVFGGDSSDSAPLIQWPVDGGLNEQFQLEQTTDGYYTLTALHSGKCLDLFGGNTVPGAVINQWSCGGGDHQKFAFESVGVGIYRIRPKSSGLCLAVFADSVNDGYAIVQDICANKPSQQFTLQSVL
jgi:hypothetical protein